MVRVHPHPPRLGSSVVEQGSEEPCVVSSILTPGTKNPSAMCRRTFCCSESKNTQNKNSPIWGVFALTATEQTINNYVITTSTTIHGA